MESGNNSEVEDCSLMVGNYCVSLLEGMEFKSVDDKIILSDKNRKLVIVMEEVSANFTTLSANLDLLRTKYIANGYTDVSCQNKEYNKVPYIDIMFLRDGKPGKTIFLKCNDGSVLSLVMVAEHADELGYGEEYMMSLLQQVRNREVIA